MTTSANVYGLALKSLVNAEIDFDSNTIKCLLTTNSYTPNQDTHQYLSSITNELANGVSGVAGYGRVTLSGKSVSYSTSTNTLSLGCSDVLFASLTGVCRYAVFFKDSGSAATSPLICYMDFGTDVTVTAQDLTIIMPTTALMQITAA